MLADNVVQRQHPIISALVLFFVLYDGIICCGRGSYCRYIPMYESHMRGIAEELELRVLSVRFGAFLPTEGGCFPVCFFCYHAGLPASTAPGEGLPGCLLGGSRSRRRRRSVSGHQSVGMCMPANNLFQIMKREFGVKTASTAVCTYTSMPRTMTVYPLLIRDDM